MGNNRAPKKKQAERASKSKAAAAAAAAAAVTAGDSSASVASVGNEGIRTRSTRSIGRTVTPGTQEGPTAAAAAAATVAYQPSQVPYAPVPPLPPLLVPPNLTAASLTEQITPSKPGNIAGVDVTGDTPPPPLPLPPLAEPKKSASKILYCDANHNIIEDSKILYCDKDLNIMTREEVDSKNDKASKEKDKNVGKRKRGTEKTPKPPVLKVGEERKIVCKSNDLGIKVNRGPDGIIRIIALQNEKEIVDQREGEITVGDIVRQVADLDLRKSIDVKMWNETVIPLMKNSPRPLTLIVAAELSELPEELKKDLAGITDLSSPKRAKLADSSAKSDKDDTFSADPKKKNVGGRNYIPKNFKEDFKEMRRLYKEEKKKVEARERAIEQFSQPCTYSVFAGFKLEALQKIYCAAGLPYLINDETLDGAHTCPFRTPAAAVTAAAKGSGTVNTPIVLEDANTTSEVTVTATSASTTGGSTPSTNESTSVAENTSNTTVNKSSTISDVATPTTTAVTAAAAAAATSSTSSTTASNTSAPDVTMNDTAKSSSEVTAPAVTDTSTPSATTTGTTEPANTSTSPEVATTTGNSANSTTSTTADQPSAAQGANTTAPNSSSVTLGAAAPSATIKTILNGSRTVPTSRVDLIYRLTFHPRTKIFAWSKSVIGKDKAISNILTLRKMCKERNILRLRGSDPIKEKMIIAILLHDYRTDLSEYNSQISRIEENQETIESTDLDLEIEDMIKEDTPESTSLDLLPPLTLPPSHFPRRTEYFHMDETFNTHFSELLKFKEEHGHTKVPITNKSLYSWCSSVRDFKRNTDITNAGGKLDAFTSTIQLTQSQIEKLCSIGFDWGMAYNSGIDRFEYWFKVLKEYKEAHGNMTIKEDTEENKALGSWCNNVRTAVHDVNQNPNDTFAQYRFNNQQLDKARIERLNEVGFEWSVTPPTFEERIEQLLAYKEQHGSFNLKESEDEYPGLRSWLDSTKANARNYDYNQTSSQYDKRRVPPTFTAEHFSRLKELGLWVTKDFDHYYQKLVEWKQLHGHMDVSVCKYDAPPTLAVFCRHTREIYKAMKVLEENPDDEAAQTELANAKGKLKFDITPERIAQLDSLEFVWSGTKDTKPFHEHLDQLRAYKERYGHANPPHVNYPRDKDDNDEFYMVKRWCMNVKKWARNFEYNQNLPDDASEKDKRHIGDVTEENLLLLDEVGFPWRKTTKDWDRRLNDLIAYKDVYGKTNVPMTKKNNPYYSLGTWCGNMRRAYKLKKKYDENPTEENKQIMKKAGKSISDEKVQKLRDIGFDFGS